MFKSIVLPTLLCVAVSWTHAAVSHAQTVPYRSVGEGAEYYPSSLIAGTYAASGKARPLGKFSTTGELNVAPLVVAADAFVGIFSGTHEDVAANGDVLRSDIFGEVVLEIDPFTGIATGTWEIEFTITGGTGRFAKATGSMVGIATNHPFYPFVDEVWPFDWDIEGEIHLNKKK